MITINGELQIDFDRGVVWFNDETGVCRLRVCNIPKRLMGIPVIWDTPILADGMIDVRADYKYKHGEYVGEKDSPDG